MVRELDLLDAVRQEDVVALQKVLHKHKNSTKSKLIGSGKRLNINYQDDDGMTALHQAALVGNTGIMKMLLENDASVDIKDMKGMRPLHYAAWQGREPPVVSLLDRRSSVNEPAKDGITPLHLACEHGHYAVVELLLQHQGDPSIVSQQSKTPLDLACEFGKYRVAELLIQSNMCNKLLLQHPSDMASKDSVTCLHLAAKNGHTDVIRLLLQAGVDINRQTPQGTCLHEAALYGKIEVVKLLLDCGIDVSRFNSYEQTALDIVKKFTATHAAKELKTLLKDASRAVQVRAIKPYFNSQSANHISFQEGSYITVVEQHPSGMWKGYVTSDGQITKTGYFPSSCVVLVDTHGNLPNSQNPVLTNPVPDLISRQVAPPCAPPMTHLDVGPYSSVGLDDTFPPPPSPLVVRKEYSGRDSDRDSGISPQQSYPNQVIPGTQVGYPGRQHSPTSPADRTAEWLGRYVGNGDTRSSSPGHDSANSSKRNSTASSNGSGSVLPGHNCVGPPAPPPTTSSSQPAFNHHHAAGSTTQQHHSSAAQLLQHRLSGQSYESGVSSARHSYHSTSSSSLGSLDRLEESGYSSTVNVHDLFQAGLTDAEVLHAWLSELHFEEYYPLFTQAAYDMPTISRMTPEDLTAIGITKPAHRKRLKAEISKLHIHDGIPDFKPGDVASWLSLLHLEDYYETLLNQGYNSIDDLTDIAWEDLEEIGIKKLGHQKKIMLAIDRLTRINTNSKRLSSGDHKGSTEVLEPASSFPTPQWLDTDSAKPRQYGPPSSPKHYPPPVSPSYGIRYGKPSQCASGENLAPVSETVPLSQPTTPLRDDASHLVHMRHAKQHVVYTPDVVAIHVNRTPIQRGSNIPDDVIDGVDQGPALVTSFHGGTSSGQWDSSMSAEDSGGDLTPTNDRRGLSLTATDEQMGGTLRRNTAVINPRITIKPKPVAKIYAKTKRISREFPVETLKTGEPPVAPSVVYSSNTLPRKSSSKTHEQQMEAMYNRPVADAGKDAMLLRPSSNHSAPCSPAHHIATGNTPGHYQIGRTKKPVPPPPPKRTNSIKSDMRVTSAKPPVPAQCAISSANAASGSTFVPQQQKMQQAFSSCVASLAERGNARKVKNHEPSAPKPAHVPEIQAGFPPPPTPLGGVTGPVGNFVETGSDSSLSDVIKRLEQTAAPCTTAAEMTAGIGGAPNYTNTNSAPGYTSIGSAPNRTNTGGAPGYKNTISSTDTGNAPNHTSTASAPSYTSTSSATAYTSTSGASTVTKPGTQSESILRTKEPKSECNDLPRRNDSTISLESNISVCSTDSNTLPFANENVGTIKQRNPPSKTSVVAISTDDDQTESEVAHGYTADATGPGEDSRKVPPAAPQRRESIGITKRLDQAAVEAVSRQPAQKTSDAGDVLSDIGNMLQDLTDELDAMLECDLDLQ